MKEKGIVKGYDDGTYKPSNAINRAEFTKIIIDGYDDGTFKGSNEINFVEAAKIIVTGFDLAYEEGEQWYEGYVNVLQENNSIPPAITSLSMQITRGEMAESLYQK